MILFRGAGRCEPSTPPHCGGVAAADRLLAIPDGARIAMRKTLLTTTLAALCTLPAAAADRPANGSLRIESETQFARDYAAQAERLAPGVYQMIAGPLAGKVVSMGEAGLAYDLAQLRATKPASLAERKMLRERIKLLETAQGRYGHWHAQQPPSQAKVTQYWVFPCFGYVGGTYYNYYATANLQATTEYLIDNGSGQPNPYYARSYANAYGSVAFPPNHFNFGSLGAYTLAWNKNSGQKVERRSNGVYVAAGTGDVYSGPDFVHDLQATAIVLASGECAGYASVSDALKV